MPNFNTHVNFAVLFYPIIVIFYEFFSKFLNYPLPNKEIIGLGFLFFWISADVPDIDHIHSTFRKIIKYLIISVIIYFEFNRGYIIRLFNLETVFYSYSMKILEATLVGILLGKLIEYIIPKHRGPLHTIWSAFIYGLIIFFGYYFLFYIVKNALFLGIISTIGYLMHLILDKLCCENNGKLRLKIGRQKCL
jgi:hypothetical protein